MECSVCFQGLSMCEFKRPLLNVLEIDLRLSDYSKCVV